MLGTLQPEIREVMYVNTIESGELWRGFSQIGRVFRYWRDLADEPPAPPIQIALRTQHPIRDERGVARGGLEAALDGIGVTEDEREIITLKVLARCRPDGKSTDQVMTSLDLGRRAMVENFVAMTTPETHEYWGLQQ